MARRRIDAVSRSLAASHSRRSVFAVAAALLAVPAPATPDIEAKGKKKKRCKTVKCFGKCPPAGAECCYQSYGWCDPGLACCGTTTCMPDLATCCPNGSFCGYREACCPPSPAFPIGGCIPSTAPAGTICCQDYLCYPGQSCCPPPSYDPAGGYCVWNDEGFCCPANVGGGYCFFGEKCCPPIPGYPAGFCVPLYSYCPTSAETLEARALIKPKRRSGSTDAITAASPGKHRNTSLHD